MTTLQFPNRELVETQAATWVAIIDRGLSGGQEQKLNQWLAESTLHGEVLVQLASMWDLLDVLSPIANLLPIDADSAQQRVSSANTQTSTAGDMQSISSHSTTRRYAIAAGIGLLAIGLFLVPQVNTFMQSWSTSFANIKQSGDQKSVFTNVQTYVTAVGERSNITLDDGSELKLNTDSEITVKFSQDQRRLELSKGEAYFEVAKNPLRPFVVLTNNSRVTAVGTAFSIDVSNVEDTHVLVTHGRVKVDRLLKLNKQNQAKQVVTAPPVYLSEGQTVLLNKNTVQVDYSDNIDSDLAWREGRLIFTGQSLAEVIGEIDRYIPLQFKIMDKEITTIPVGGFFKTGDLDQLLLVLEQNFGVASKRQGNQILLSKAL